MTLDTNVYATASQTLSCKIDKTPPTVTCHYPGTGYAIDYWHFTDNLSGCYEFTVTGFNYWNSSYKGYFYANGSYYQQNITTKTRLTTSSVTTDSGNFYVYGNGTSSNATSTQYTCATLTVYDLAGNSSSRGAGVYYGGSNNRQWYHYQ